MNNISIYISTIIWIVSLILFSFRDQTVGELRGRIAWTTLIMFIFQYFYYIR